MKGTQADQAAKRVLVARETRRRVEEYKNAGDGPEDRLPTGLAIDPGEEHCGLAWFVKDPDTGWACTMTREVKPDTGTDLVAQALLYGDLDWIAMERFILFPDLAAAQTRKEMLTSEQIGAIKWLHRLNQQHIEAHQAGLPRACNGEGCLQVPVRLSMQPADVQKPMLGVLRKRGIKSTSKQEKTGPHTLSAELHGWYYVTKIVEENTP